MAQMAKKVNYRDPTHIAEADDFEKQIKLLEEEGTADGEE